MIPLPEHNLTDPDLWARLCNFNLDEPASDFPFSKRLARENSWSCAFARQAIEEYKKFAYLACVSDTPVTPSDEVDQVWHLHLTCTRSYWNEFCPRVLEQELHHDPTRGGATEAEKFHNWYEKTKLFYQNEFGTPPPENIWPSSDIRFSKAPYMKRIDTSASWVIPHRTPIRPACFVGALSLPLLLAGCKVLGYELTDTHIYLIAGFLVLLLIIMIITGKGGGGSGCGGGCGNGGSSGCSGGSGCGGGGCGG